MSRADSTSISPISRWLPARTPSPPSGLSRRPSPTRRRTRCWIFRATGRTGGVRAVALFVRRAADRPPVSDHPTDQLRTRDQRHGRRNRWHGLGEQRPISAMSPWPTRRSSSAAARVPASKRVRGSPCPHRTPRHRRSPPGPQPVTPRSPAPATPTRPQPPSCCERTAGPRTAAAHPPDTRPTRPPDPSAPLGSVRPARTPATSAAPTRALARWWRRLSVRGPTPSPCSGIVAATALSPAPMGWGGDSDDFDGGPGGSLSVTDRGDHPGHPRGIGSAPPSGKTRPRLDGGVTKPCRRCNGKDSMRTPSCQSNVARRTAAS